MSEEFSKRVRRRSADMSKTDHAIAAYLMEHAQDACHQTSAELAEAIGVSKSAITRFTKLMGYESLREMRVQLASTTTLPTIFFDDFAADSALGTARSMFENGANSLIETMSELREKDLDAAVELLGRARVCGLFGTGGSQAILYSAFHRFQRTSLRMLWTPDLHLQFEMATNLTSEDCALVISHSGRNKDVLRAASILHENDVPILLITSNPISPLASESDVVICSVADETRFRPEAVTSTVAQMVLVDTLFALYAMRFDGESKQRFARIREVIEATRV
ncbi:MAG: MurR/RpiR family transcriptional regulator [Atopobiaceae bacterium]|nr:MurR/RpiR family transcriptional regulator [Atopobiaceae bacterium]